MQTEILLQALLQLWDELPDLFGPAWGTVYPQLEVILTRLSGMRSPAEQSTLLDEIMHIFSAHPRVKARLFEALQFADATREIDIFRGSGAKGSLEQGEVRGLDARDALAQRLNPATETRYTDITAPTQLPLGRRGDVTARLTCRPEAGSLATHPLQLHPQQPVEILLRARNAAVEVTDGAVRRVMLEPGQDSEPASFYIWERQAGIASLMLEFFQAGNQLDTVQFAVEVASPAASEQTQALTATVGLGGP